jgi:glycosyltransferase involved in cell wall biosynthesis
VRRDTLRVALFTGNFNYTHDGATQALGRLVAHLRQVEGAEVRIYSPTSPDAPPVEGLWPIPSIALPGRSEYRLGLGLSAAARSNLAAFDPDVIHLSTPDLVGMQAQRLGRQLGRPIIASLHTRFESYLAYYGLAFLEPVLERRLMEYYARCDYVLVPNKPIAQDMSAGSLKGRVRVWSRGVDRELFDPRRRSLAWRRARGLGEKDFVVLFFGRVVVEKGLAMFADAFERLRIQRPGVRALVVGDGPAKAWMMQRLPDAIYTGFLRGPHLAEAVASADALLNPSTTEAFGNVNLEAMACGLPVVSADMPSSRALIRDGVSGLLHAGGDVDGYAASLKRLHDDPALRAAIGRAAREASAAFSWTAAMSSVADLYREAIGRPARVEMVRPEPSLAV